MLRGVSDNLPLWSIDTLSMYRMTGTSMSLGPWHFCDIVSLHHEPWWSLENTLIGGSFTALNGVLTLGRERFDSLKKWLFKKKGLESCLKTLNLNMDWIFVRQPTGNHLDFKGIVIRNGMDVFQLIEDGCSRAGSDAIEGK